MYHLAGEMLAGIDDVALYGLPRVFEPAMSRRLVDLGAVGIPQDPTRWDPANYSHHLRAFEDVYLPGAPYVDQQKFAEVQAQFADYVQRMIAYGNNGIVIPGFLEFINFDKVGDGFEVYPAGSEYRARHLALRDAYNQLIDYARDGMKVYLYTDMLALRHRWAYLSVRWAGHRKPHLVAGLQQRSGRLAVRCGVDGLMIRVGEARKIYNLPAGTHLALVVRSVESARRCSAFTDVPKQDVDHFRTWSVGVGEVGACTPIRTATAASGIGTATLIISTG
jgi:hypothetical protein